jgi:hypothetical protein
MAEKPAQSNAEPLGRHDATWATITGLRRPCDACVLRKHLNGGSGPTGGIGSARWRRRITVQGKPLDRMYCYECARPIKAAGEQAAVKAGKRRK